MVSISPSDALPRAIILIPARLGSTRLPNKPLARIAGLPMILHAWRRALAAEIGPVAIACAERAIAETVWAAGGEAVLTDPDHPSGSDRIFEALGRLDPAGRYDIVVNLQGDLPTIEPRLLKAVLEPLADPAVDIATLCAPIRDAEEAANPNVVKIAIGFRDDRTIARALYFSRAAIPANPGPLYHHIGLYAYRRAALARFVSLAPGRLETRERLEQLRALEAGMRIDVRCVDTIPLGVDTPADLARAEAILAADARS